MRMIVHYNGLEYASKNNPSLSAREASDDFYEHISNITGLHFERHDGTFVVFSKTVIDNAVFVFED